MQASSSQPTVIRVAGAISGALQLPAGAPVTVGALRSEAARVANVESASIKLICSGRTLQDDSKLLSEAGVGPTSRVLVSKGAAAAAALGAAAAAQQQSEAREARLEKLRAVVEKLSGRGDGRGLTDKYEFELQNQDGTRLTLAPADRKALVMGLALHSQGQATLKAAAAARRREARAARGRGGDSGEAAAAAAANAEGAGAAAAAAAAAAEGETVPTGSNAGARGAASGSGGNTGRARGDESGIGAAGADALLRQALEELLMAEEAFDLVGDRQLLQAVDNLAMLLLDIVWCCYLLQDVGRLGVSAERLGRARAALERAHGPNLERLRALQRGFAPEVATYVRLETLEGVVAYHSGDAAAAARRLEAARDRWQRLQVPAEALVQLLSMGFGTRESTRALRFCGGSVPAAVTLIGDERSKSAARAEERHAARAWLSERAAYGTTPGRGLYVDREPLEQLVTLGYDKRLAAEALRTAENNLQSALDTLTDPVKAGALGLALVAQQIKEVEEGPQDVSARKVQKLVAMGFQEKAARVALKEAGRSFTGAVDRLTPGGGGGGGAAEPPRQRRRRRRRQRRSAAGNGGGGSGSGSEDGSDSGSPADSEEERLEASLVAAARGGGDDPMAAYDLDLREEAAAIEEYLGRLAAAAAAAAGGTAAPAAAAGATAGR